MTKTHQNFNTLLTPSKVLYQSAGGDINIIWHQYDIHIISGISITRLKRAFPALKLSIVAESTKKTIAYKPGIDLQDAYCYAERKIEDKSSDI